MWKQGKSENEEFYNCMELVKIRMSNLDDELQLLSLEIHREISCLVQIQNILYNVAKKYLCVCSDNEKLLAFI